MEEGDDFLPSLSDAGEAARLAGSIDADKIARSWQVCELLFPEQRAAWSRHANSPMMLASCWATASLFNTSCHAPHRLLALATAACCALLNTHNWYTADHVTALQEEGFSAAQARHVLALRCDVRLADLERSPLFDEREHAVLALAHHLLWLRVHRVAGSADGQREHRARDRVRMLLKAAQLSPQQIVELTWRVSHCAALAMCNDFLVAQSAGPPPNSSYTAVNTNNNNNNNNSSASAAAPPSSLSSVSSSANSSDSADSKRRSRSFADNAIAELAATTDPHSRFVQSQTTSRSNESSAPNSPSMGRGTRRQSMNASGKGRGAPVHSNPYK